jgi:hypothetical protein
VGCIDLSTYGSVCLLLLGFGLLAFAVPAWRAATRDPVAGLEAS